MGFPVKSLTKQSMKYRQRFKPRMHCLQTGCLIRNRMRKSKVQKNDGQEATPYICLPYKGMSGESIVTKFRDDLTKALPSYVKPRFIYKGKKLGSCFRIKDKVPQEHETDLIYAFRPNYNSKRSTDYVGETNVRYETRTYEHCFTDKKSSIHKHKEDNNLAVSQSDFEILDKGYKKRLNRKLAEALYIKDFKPKLNEQKQSYKLLLFN